MIDRDIILLLSVCLFCIGIVGALYQKNVIKVIISIEVIVFSSIINFCYFAGGKSIKSGHFAAFTAVIISGLVISVIYTIITQKQTNNSYIPTPINKPKDSYDI